MKNTEFKIDTGIKIPKRCVTNKSKYPFGELRVGDSFFVATEDTARLTIASSASAFARRHPEYKFITRKEGDGLRVWRIEAKK